MRKIKTAKVGMVVEVPIYCFAPHRNGWDGWIFRVGIIDKVGTSNKGNKVAVVRYRDGKKEYGETTELFHLDRIFEFKYMELYQKMHSETPKDAFKNEPYGTNNYDIQFLIHNGYIQ